MTITYALIQMVEKIAERKPDLARIITKARAHTLLTNSSGACMGLTYEKMGPMSRHMDLSSSRQVGLGADFTNSEHCASDGIKMGEATEGIPHPE